MAATIRSQDILRRVLGRRSRESSTAKPDWRAEALAVSLPLIAFALLAGPHLSLPGLYYDEAADAVPAMQLVLGQPVQLLRGAGIELFGRALPLMTFDYVGAVHTYAVIPFFALLGASVTSLRLMTLAGGALTIALTYLWLRNLAGSRWAGWAGALLLATHPSFVYYVRQGVHVSSLMAVWSMAALCLLLYWWRTGHGRWLIAGCFVLGLGLSTKILFAWFILALAVVLLMLQITAARRWLGAAPAAEMHVSPGLTLAAVAAFTAGAGMLLIYNVATWGTVKALFAHTAVSLHGVQNTAYLANLADRLESLGTLLDGGHFWFLGGNFANGWYPSACAVAIAVAVAAALRPSGQKWRAGVALTLALILLVLLQSPVTLSDIYPTHLFILLPLLSGAMALGCFLLARNLPPLGGLGLATVVVALLAYGNAQVDLQYRAALLQSGGLRGHSDAINRLASFLDESGIPQPLAMDWGMKYNIELLTQGRVQPAEVFQYAAEPDAHFHQWLRQTLQQSERFYLFHTQDYTIYPRWQIFSATAEAAGVTPQLVASFPERDGTPLYFVYRAP